MRRWAAIGLVVTLLAAGCGSGPGVRNRSVAKGLLVALTLAAAGGAVGSAVLSERKEKSLRDDVEMGLVSGRQFADRDAEGKRWNRTARASVLVGGLAIVGLVIAWQMGLGDRYQFGPPEQPAGRPLYPSDGAAGQSDREIARRAHSSPRLSSALTSARVRRTLGVCPTCSHVQRRRGDSSCQPCSPDRRSGAARPAGSWVPSCPHPRLCPSGDRGLQRGQARGAGRRRWRGKSLRWTGTALLPRQCLRGGRLLRAGRGSARSRLCRDRADLRRRRGNRHLQRRELCNHRRARPAVSSARSVVASARPGAAGSAAATRPDARAGPASPAGVPASSAARGGSRTAAQAVLRAWTTVRTRRIPAAPAAASTNPAARTRSARPGSCARREETPGRLKCVAPVAARASPAATTAAAPPAWGAPIRPRIPVRGPVLSAGRPARPAVPVRTARRASAARGREERARPAERSTRPAARATLPPTARPGWVACGPRRATAVLRVEPRVSPAATADSATPRVSPVPAEPVGIRVCA